MSPSQRDGTSHARIGVGVKVCVTVDLSSGHTKSPLLVAISLGFTKCETKKVGFGA